MGQYLAALRVFNSRPLSVSAPFLLLRLIISFITINIIYKISIRIKYKNIYKFKIQGRGTRPSHFGRKA